MLRIAAGVELVSLVVLFTNIATVHWDGVSSLVGPAHGCAYLIVVVLAFARRAGARVGSAAMVPGFGGLIVLRLLAGSADRQPLDQRGLKSEGG
ncbi:hypothetical protein A8924_4660 [Saccharopolyspora erythraea NRRL 2338]|uniref:Uncharacterized protein n=2 Tax=Saccharopolyspora erythraea TaxID=1836 RepID=A4FHL5_SACEN|nr:hypothetical protein N599_34005 [Saccharopolyspora erythraea D]PFG97230.1 hypothetical protein A8924_4660 [Saccharopolyspora erythraea NRRL 2338]QRK93704.1 DUF3817 domain-containing protein [Saccharopolyspora erythraea]CAM03540.1 hypothetical protein SACE_4271 [Saccharopolyspora erythraea NRRL 2338]